MNAINADQVETPLFLQFVKERAASRGVSVEEQLKAYRSRNLMGATLIPPEAVADVAVLLASDRFRFTTGTSSRWMADFRRRSPVRISWYPGPKHRDNQRHGVQARLLNPLAKPVTVVLGLHLITIPVALLETLKP